MKPLLFFGKWISPLFCLLASSSRLPLSSVSSRWSNSAVLDAFSSLSSLGSSLPLYGPFCLFGHDFSVSSCCCLSLALVVCSSGPPPFAVNTYTNVNNSRGAWSGRLTPVGSIGGAAWLSPPPLILPLSHPFVASLWVTRAFAPSLSRSLAHSLSAGLALLSLPVYVSVSHPLFLVLCTIGSPVSPLLLPLPFVPSL